MGIDASKSADRNRSSIKLRRKDFRTLLCENLERRDLMAVDGPRLLSIAPNSGEIFSTTSANSLNESPRELVFRFDAAIAQGTLNNGIRITRAGGDGAFGSAGSSADVIVPPAYLSFSDPANQRVIVARFAQPLLDDLYRVEVFGVDMASPVTTAIKDTSGLVLKPRRALTDRDTYEFDLELGTKINAVVPQPINRNAAGVLTQRSKDIEIYFNDAELYNQAVKTGDLAPAPDPRVVDPQYYKLIFTNETVSPNDDTVISPSSISYDPVARKATLSFLQNIETYGSGSGTFRLRVGASEQPASLLTPIVPKTLDLLTVPSDPSGFLDVTQNIPTNGPIVNGNVTGSFSTIITQEIRSVGSDQLLADFPGSNLEPGHRDVQDESHLDAVPGQTADPSTAITRVRYSFMDDQVYGFDAQNRPLKTSIGPEQKQRIREIFELYSTYIGIDVVEYLGSTVAGDGILKVVLGDMFPNGARSGTGDVLGITEGDLAIIDNAEAWDNAFGFGIGTPNSISFFDTAIQEVGRLLGLGNSFDLPPGTQQGEAASLGRAANPLEQLFPGSADIVHAQHRFRPDNRDVDLYRFVVSPGEAGELRAETIAERLNDSSTLDTHLTLFRRESTGSLTVVAANNNYFSEDSMVRVNIGPGEYFLSVTGKGNEDNDPTTSNTGSGATSQGRYQLRVDYKSSVISALAENRAGSSVVGTAFDGDGDGLAGGNFDFWFRSVAPYTGGVAALVSDVSPARTLLVDKAYTGGPLLQFGSFAQPFTKISQATSAARPGDIIRIVGDTRTSSLTDDLPYEIGNAGGAIGVLSDGVRLDVPSGVTMMVDAGAILKFIGAGILVGSDPSRNQSGATVQILGIPGVPVYMTSYRDESLGRDPDTTQTSTPGAGNWGGIEIRNDVDRAQGRFDLEREGIFLNVVSNADIRFGGGKVGVGAAARAISPIDLFESRPLVLNSQIRNSGDAAMSADPNSFEETLFTEPRYQNGTGFVPDYSRVGPEIRLNSFVGNSINGLLVKVASTSTGGIQPLSVAGRINDAEVPIVLGDNLIIEGTPGGPLFESIGPDTSLLTLKNIAPTAGSGFSSAIPLEYLITYVDRFGQESLPSATRTISSQVGKAVELTQLPTATLDYVARKIWRRENNSGPYKLAGLVNKDDTTFVDNARTLAGSLPQPQVANQLQRARRDASLVIDPGSVIKSSGVRIEVGIGATLLAEGSKSNNIVFTSRSDDRFGAAGTFDTNNDGLGAGSAGDWGGIVSRHLGEVSIDNAIITFGGGATSVPGGFASFNAIELHQSTARIANSVIENNASGRGTPGTSNRDARGVNDEAAIFVLGSQPVLINNTIRGNSQGTGTPSIATAAISIDANSLNTKSVRDFGRSIGLNQREQIGIGNFGPLVFNNLLGNNGINGMVVRGATLTTESVWDDTSIVHVVLSEIVVPDFHTYGGLRLASRATESLVVKLNGAQAGFTATGRPLDITDRIGGSLQLLGAPGFPVVLTALADDTIGAGFDFSGRSLGDTNNDGNATTATAGSWRSVRFEPFSNDRNVDQSYEREPDLIGDQGTNDFPSNAQDLGTLSSSVENGDENVRLGFTLTGSIASPSDLDVYRFLGTAGTTVWLDIDQTSGTLDSVVELINGNGQIIALSNDSLAESVAGATQYSNTTLIPDGRVLPMDQIATAERNRLVNTQVDFQGVNPLDAGMRVVLPGSAGSAQDYFIRVRSSNVSPVPGSTGTDRSSPTRLIDSGLVREGISVGQYKLHVRLRQMQEIAGSAVRYADVRYATIGIDAAGQPLHSPLLGETSESNPLETSSAFTPQIIGNVGSSDRGAISIAGNFASGNGLVPDDFIDFYRFTARRDSVQQNSLTEPYHVSLIFDVDYADGQGRANTQLWIFDASGRLVLTSDNSNIHDDQPAATRGSDVTDLTRGSQGVRDAYIGPIELPAGDYFVGISNKSQSHVALRQFTDRDAAGFAGVRMEPIESVRRIAEDRYDSSLISPRPTTAVPPVMYDPSVPITQTGAFPIQSNAASLYPSPTTANTGFTYQPQFDSQVGFNLSDVTLFTTVGRNVDFVNPLTGALEAIYSTNGTQAVNFGPNNNSLNDLVVAPDGRGIAYQNNTGTTIDANQGTFVSVDLGNGAFGTGTSGLISTTTRLVTPPATPPTFEVIQVPNAGGNNGVGTTFDGLTFSQLFAANNGADASFWGVASRNSFFGNEFQPIIRNVNNTPTAVGVGLPVINKNILYRLSSYDTGTLGTALDPANQGTFNAAERGIGAGTGILAHGYFVKPNRSGIGNFTTTDNGTPAITSAASLRFVEKTINGVTVTVNFTNGGASILPQNPVPPSVTVVGNVITVNLQGGSQTLDSIVTAITGNVAANALVSVSLTFGLGSEIIRTTPVSVSVSQLSGEVNVGGIRTNSQVVAADGTVTGLASVDVPASFFPIFTPASTRLYAVTDQGELMGLTPNANARHILSDSYVVIRDPNTNLPIVFSGLTTGPRDVVDGFINYSQMLFGTTANGRLYAFNTAGTLQNIFPGGNSFVDTAAFGATGISFSSADSNLWHLSTHRATETGHGIQQNFNQSNGPGGLNSLLRFGYADPTKTEGVPRGDYRGIYGVQTARRDTISAPGGARGAIESKLIDLSEYSADDQPYLYFNYRLDAEDANHAINVIPANAYALDTFRVYGTSADGNWILLSTNNAPDVNSSLTPFVNERNFDSPYNQVGVNEFDSVVSRNVDAFGRVGNTSELFDNAQWRQARVSLASLAGKQDVRLRFEFATGGSFRSVLNFDSKGNVVVDSTRNGLEINAVPGERFVNSSANPSVEAVHTFSLRNITTALTNFDDISNSGFTTTDTFQFDLGLVLNLPSGASLKTGDQIKIRGNLFTFSNVAGPLNIPFAASDTPAQVATKVRSVLTNFGYRVFTSTNAANLLNVTDLFGVRLPDSVAANDYDIIGADKGIIAGRPGVLSGNRPVFINNAMTATQVRDAIRGALVSRYSIGPGKDIDTYRVNRNTIFFHTQFNQFFDGISNSPVSVSNGRTGDISGAGDGGLAGRIDLFRASFATRNNTGANEGVLIDDIIIGFAERGETVFNGPASNQTFRTTPFYEPFLVVGQPPIEEPELGTYQLEIRTAADYGITDRNGQLRLVDPSVANPSDPQAFFYGNVQWGRTYDTNDRLTKTLALSVTSPASQINDGSFFTLSDGYNTATFEFDVTTSSTDTRVGVTSGNIAIPLSPAFTKVQIAKAIRDAINGPTSRARLKLSASTNGDMENASASVTGARSSLIYLNGNAASDVLGGMNFSSGGAPLTVIEFGKEAALISNPPNLPVRPSYLRDFGEDLGDGNTLREQGQFIVSSSVIRSSLGFGINLGAAPQAQSGASTLTGIRPYPGSVRNLITLNSGNVAPGAVVINNVLYDNASGGIAISGDTTSTNGVPPSTVVRVINNTLYGKTVGTSGSGIGINVSNAAAPTIINNIVSNFATGILVSANSTSRTELGFNIYKQNNNGANVVGGPAETGAIYLLLATDPLFLRPADGLFYPAPLSQAIDSSNSSQGNRSTIEQVRSAVGLSSSTLFAPFLDVNGLVRSDDPDVSSTSGSGSNVFIDRGAIDRVDFAGPIATLTKPLDNDSLGVDRDRFSTFVRLSKGNLGAFEILLDEFSGTGTDVSTITSNSLILTENGRKLIEGSDYFFGFSANSRTIRLTPTAGFWRNDSIYEMTLINKPTLRYDVGNGASTPDGRQIKLQTTNGLPVTLEFDAAGSPAVTGSFVVTVPGAGLSIADGAKFSIRSASGQTVFFEFDKDSIFTLGNRQIAITDLNTADEIAIAIKNAIAASSLGFSPTTSGPTVKLMETRGSVFNVLTSGLTLKGVSGGAIAIPYNATFTNSTMAGQIVKAFNSVGLGIKVYSLSDRTIVIDGITPGVTTGVGITEVPPITDLAGNFLQANRSNSLTQFTIVMPDAGVDFGDAIERPATGSTSSTLLANNGARHALYPEDVPVLALGQFADADLDGKPSPAADGDDFGSAFTFSSGLPLSLSSRGPTRLVVSTPVFPGVVGETISITDTLGKNITFEFTNTTAWVPATAYASGVFITNGGSLYKSLSAHVSSAVFATDLSAGKWVTATKDTVGLNIGVNLTVGMTAQQAAAALAGSVSNPSLGGIFGKAIDKGLITGIYSVQDSNVVALGGTTGHIVGVSNVDPLKVVRYVQKQASGDVGIAVPAIVSGLASGQTFTIQDGSGRSVTFQFINSVSPTVLLAGNTAITLDLTAGVQTQSTLANAVLKAINDAIAAGKLRLPQATLASNIINVNADDEDGVQFVGLFNSKTPPVSVNVTSTDTGYLDAWVDWNQDNDFDDVGEQIIRTEPVNSGVNTFLVTTPATALSGYTTARFRLSATGGLLTTGLGIGGEVEDHIIEILRGTPPTALNDSYTVNEGPVPLLPSILNVPVTGVPYNGVLFNDSDADGDLVTVFDSDPNIAGVQPFILPMHAKSFTLNADGSFSYIPADNYFGTDTFVYQVTDPRLVSNQTATVTITITPVNDAPFGTDKVQQINEDNNGSPFVFSAASFGFNDTTDIPASNSLLEVIIVTLPPAADGVLMLSGVNVVAGQAIPVLSIPNLTFTPTADLNNITLPLPALKGTFTFRVRDDGGVALGGIDTSVIVNTFSFDIVPVNDPPVFTLLSKTINLVEDPGSQTLTNFVTGIATGPSTALDELASQTVTFRVRPLDPTRFTISGQPKVTPASITSIPGGAKGTLTFTLAPDVNSVNSGPILVELVADDQSGGGGLPNGPLSVPQTVTINVQQVNDPPTFTISPTTFNTAEDTPRTIITNFLSAVLVGPATAVDETNQTSIITVVATDPSLYSFQPRLTGTGDLEFQLAPDVNSQFSNSLNIVVTVMDNGTPSESTSKTLTINATPQNDAPSFVLSATSITVREDEESFPPVTTQTVIPNFVQNLRRGPVTARDEEGLESVAAQGLIFTTIIASNPSLFSVQPTIDIATGNLIFHTAPDRSGSSVFVIRLTDDGLAGPPPNNNIGPTATFTINIKSVNDAPEFSLPSSTTVNEDQGVVTVPGFATGVRPGPVTAVDESTQELTFDVVAENPLVFSVQPTLQADGTLVFQTAKDVNNNTRDINGALLSRRVFVSLRDNGASVSPNVNQSGQQIFTVNITPVNDPPIPSVHVRPGLEDTRIGFTASSILSAVSPESPDAPGPLDEQAQLVRMTQIERTTDHGGVVTPVFGTGLLADQIVSFEYNPPLNFVGNDLIRYVVTDNGSPEQSATGTVTIQLAPVNDPPQFIAGGDITAQEDAIAFSAAWATAILAGPPSALDEINGVPPLTPAQTVSFALTTNNNAMFSVLPAVSPTGVLTFTLAKDANGRAIVDVVAVDSGSGTAPNNNRSAVSKLTIVANPLNDAPGFNVIGNVSVDEDSPRYTAPAIKDIVPAQGMNDTPPTGADEVGQIVSIFTSNNNNSLFSVQPTISAAGVLEFVPAQDAFGTAIVSVFARDNGANTPPNVNQSAAKTFTITLQQKNDAPVAVNDRYTTGEDTVLTVNAPGIISNDRDVDLPNDTITVSSSQTTSTLGALVSVLPNGQFTYDSRNAAQLQRLVDGETAVDTFTYTLRDAIGLTSNLATVTITVSGNNDTPVAVNDNVSVPFGTTELLNVLANDKDADNSIDPRTVEIGQLASHGTAIAQPTGRIEYRPAPGFKGIDTFTYRVRDALGALSNEALVTVTINTSPLAVADFARTNVNTPVIIDVLRNDSDPDGTLNRGSVTIASGPDVGSAAVQADGSIRYSPSAGFGGTATLQYSVLDNDGLASNLATVTIIVGGSIHQNPSNNLDVNADGSISPIDVLILVNDINFNGERRLPSTLATPPYLDPNGNGSIDPLDVLMIINYINERGNAGAGEGESSLANLGYSQAIVRTPTKDEIVIGIQQSEYRSSDKGQIDLAVSAIAGESLRYGPALATASGNDESDDSLESYLASWTAKPKRSESSLDSIFADEGWM